MDKLSQLIKDHNEQVVMTSPPPVEADRWAEFDAVVQPALTKAQRTIEFARDGLNGVLLGFQGGYRFIVTRARKHGLYLDLVSTSEGVKVTTGEVLYGDNGQTYQYYPYGPLIPLDQSLTEAVIEILVVDLVQAFLRKPETYQFPWGHWSFG